MKIKLGEFASASLRDRFGDQLSTAAETAVTRYADSFDSAAPPLDPPRFLADSPPGSAGTELELAIEPDVEATLIDAARRCDVSLDRIVTHAVFVLLADLDASAGTAPAPRAEEAGSVTRCLGDARRTQSHSASRHGGQPWPQEPLPGRDRSGCADGGGLRGGD